MWYLIVSIPDLCNLTYFNDLCKCMTKSPFDTLLIFCIGGYNPGTPMFLQDGHNHLCCFFFGFFFFFFFLGGGGGCNVDRPRPSQDVTVINVTMF